MSAAAPAVDPKSTPSLFKNSNALLLPKLCIHSTSIPSSLKASSIHPNSFSTRLVGE
jgi:hypothetical protein